MDAGASVSIQLGNDGTYVRLVGDWDLSVAPRLRETLDSINARLHVIFDLSETTYLDSSTLRVLAEFKRRSVGLAGSTAVYYGTNDRARRLMSVSGAGAFLK